MLARSDRGRHGLSTAESEDSPLGSIREQIESTLPRHHPRHHPPSPSPCETKVPHGGGKSCRLLFFPGPFTPPSSLNFSYQPHPSRDHLFIYSMFEYVPGAQLTARFTPEAQDAQVPTLSPLPRDLHFTVVRPFTPFTMSATMQIELDPQDPLCQDHAADGFVLKLYDRRAQLNTRRELDQGRDHGMAKEAEYRDFISDPSRVPVDLQAWDVIRHRNDPEHGALLECFLERSCTRSFKNESLVYRRLMQRAGVSPCPVPRFFGQVEFQSEIGVIKGILLEYITQSVSLEDYIVQAAASGNARQIADICNSAMAALSFLHDCDVLNEDAQMHNIVVQLRQGKSCPPVGRSALTASIASSDAFASSQPETALVPRCVLLDFGEARLRHEDETDLEWSIGKTAVNEDQNLAGSMLYRIERSWNPQCKIHVPVCKNRQCSTHDKKEDAPVWAYAHQWRFAKPMTDEQVQLACEYDNWGLYESRPYPMTMAEWKQMKQTESGSPVSNISCSP